LPKRRVYIPVTRQISQRDDADWLAAVFDDQPAEPSLSHDGNRTLGRLICGEGHEIRAAYLTERRELRVPAWREPAHDDIAIRQDAAGNVFLILDENGTDVAITHHPGSIGKRRI